MYKPTYSIGYHVVSHYGSGDHDDGIGWRSGGKSGKGSKGSKGGKSSKGSDKSGKGSSKSGKGSGKSVKGGKGSGKSGKVGSWSSSETRDDDWGYGGYVSGGSGKSGKGRRDQEMRRANLRASATNR